MADVTKKRTTSKGKKNLTHKQKVFVEEIVKGSTGVAAALAAYDTKDYNTANAIAVENLQKPLIKAELAALHEDIQEKIKRSASLAFNRITELVTESEDDKVALMASKDILDRAGHGAVQKTAQLSHKTITLDI